MNRFSNLLESINQKLDIPQPDKSRILLEISADLHDLFETYRERGMDQGEAQKLAEEKLSFSSESLNQLVELHQTPYRKFINRISGRTLNRWEGAMLGFLTSVLVIAFIRIMLTTTFFSNVSLFVYPVALVFLISGLLALSKFYQIFLKKDHKIKTLRSGMDLLFVLSLTGLFIGITGYFIELLYAGDFAILLETKLIFILRTTDANFGNVLEQITLWTIKISALMMFCLITSLSTISAWFFLLNKIIKIEQAEIEYQIYQ